MIDIQVRRECSKPEPVTDSTRNTCPECGMWSYGKPEAIQHRSVIVWMPLIEAITEAHRQRGTL